MTSEIRPLHRVILVVVKLLAAAIGDVAIASIINAVIPAAVCRQRRVIPLQVGIVKQWRERMEYLEQIR